MIHEKKMINVKASILYNSEKLEKEFENAKEKKLERQKNHKNV